jgi:hypothetical protein
MFMYGWAMKMYAAWNSIADGFVEEPPPGDYRSVLTAYRKHAVAIREEWYRIHGR